MNYIDKLGITHIFFDFGSTLIDESMCEARRISDTVKNSGISFEEFEKKMIYFAAQNKDAYGCAVNFFGLEKVHWQSDLEKLYDGVSELLAMLSKKCGLGIIANQNSGFAERLKAFGVSGYFNTVVVSCDAEYAKPDERIFNLALEKSECTAQEALMIGDRLDNDIIPAREAGMKTLWLRQGYGRYGNTELLKIPPDFTADSLEEIINFLTVYQI